MPPWAIFVVGVMVGSVFSITYTEMKLGSATCEARGFTNYEVRDDWTLRCYSPMTVEDE